MKPFRCVVEPGQKTAELKLYCSHGRSFRCRATEDVNKKLRDGACRIMLCFLGAALLLALENKVCICLRACTALLSGKESNELKARKVDPGHLAQFPATLRALGRAMGHSHGGLGGPSCSRARRISCSRFSRSGNGASPCLSTMVDIATEVMTICWSERVVWVLQFM